MANHPKTDAEKAMAAHAGSRRRQGVASDAASAKRERRPEPRPAPPDLTGPRGDPAEGKR